MRCDSHGRRPCTSIAFRKKAFSTPPKLLQSHIPLNLFQLPRPACSWRRRAGSLLEWWPNEVHFWQTLDLSFECGDAVVNRAIPSQRWQAITFFNSFTPYRCPPAPCRTADYAFTRGAQPYKQFRNSTYFLFLKTLCHWFNRDVWVARKPMRFFCTLPLALIVAAARLHAPLALVGVAPALLRSDSSMGGNSPTGSRCKTATHECLPLPQSTTASLLFFIL